MGKPSQPHQITILTALNGFKVKVGCAEVLFTDRVKMLAELVRYLNSPEAVEKEYLENAEYRQDTHEDEPESRVTRGIDDFIESGPVNAD